jgi:hypothetical protein
MRRSLTVYSGRVGKFSKGELRPREKKGRDFPAFTLSSILNKRFPIKHL